MSPDLVSVLLEVQRRVKGGGTVVPLSVRYDPHEKLHGEPFPHLFARRISARQEVISYAVVRRLVHELATDARLTDAGRPISFPPARLPHMFTTEMVSSGLPLHIAATLLGHLNLDTTRGYTAVFPEDVIAAHQHFIERRRTLRPLRELQTASGEEWQEFENHFFLRKVALGDCHRPYGTTCVHEHACVAPDLAIEIRVSIRQHPTVPPAQSGGPGYVRERWFYQAREEASEAVLDAVAEVRDWAHPSSFRAFSSMAAHDRSRGRGTDQYRQGGHDGVPEAVEVGD